MDGHFKKVKHHKSILMGKSPSLARIDPLIKKVDGFNSNVSSSDSVQVITFANHPSYDRKLQLVTAT